MAIEVKICGLNDPAGIDAAVAAGADWLGFVFYPPSPRNVAPMLAARLSARYPRVKEGGPRRTALFVDPTDSDVDVVLDRFKPDALQIYAPLHRVVEIRARFRLPVWMAVGVETRGDLPDSDGGVDAFLIEGKPPKDATRPGGNAVTIDWTILSDWQAPLPWLLAGGLDPSNVARAIAISGAKAVDVSSGVERERGVKDPALIAAFVKAAKAEQAAQV